MNPLSLRSRHHALPLASESADKEEILERLRSTSLRETPSSFATLSSSRRTACGRLEHFRIVRSTAFMVLLPAEVTFGCTLLDGFA